ncbi:MAG TPA: type IV toxin-antitoxin system AbiEi family antitoxin [Oligoflexus sp.]|uniref:type IV toxin-antitoxin system AbiEi family antitoxin n=1 Tax=Oligoflexus sp. TaxID=1971216 RepID=UPI002D7F3552|nr:type IV toxin-antitoxin system AbiEi family antitoxin [Oligoflexus sp.]HET9239586.1 type IV toxin-antitoxin system AbiEi family antitoxin [Oligoflexus sp.]
MNIEKSIKKSLNDFAKQTGLGIRIQSYWILASVDQAFDASIIIEVGGLEYPFWVNYNQQGKRKTKAEKIENVLEMGNLTREEKTKFLETKKPFLANNGEFSIPLTISNIKSHEARISKTPGKIESRAAENTLPSSESLAKFIHLLAATSQSAKRTQKIMADEVGISVAAVNKYLKELEASNYIVNDRARIRFVDPGKFLDLWAVEYIKKLRPGISKITFDHYDEKQYREFRAGSVMLKNGYWSAAKAADVVMKSELPERFIIYSDKPQEVVKDLRLRPSEAGKIEIRKKFWDFDWKEKTQGIVDLPLIYADLIDSGDPRDLKTAREIREIWIRSL